MNMLSLRSYKAPALTEVRILIRFAIAFILLLVIGRVALSAVSPELADNFVLYLIGILVCAVVFKVVLDIYLHKKHESDDQEAHDEVDQRPRGKIFYNIADFSRALKARHEKRTRKRAGM